MSKLHDQLRQELEEALEKSLKVPMCPLPSERDIVKMRFLMQGLRLEDNNDVFNIATEQKVATFVKAEWTKYPDQMDIHLKLMKAIDYVEIKFKVEG